MRRPVGNFDPLARFFKLTIMKSCPLFPIIGTITGAGPNTLDKGGVLYRCIEIFEAMRAYVQQPGRADAR